MVDNMPKNTRLQIRGQCEFPLGSKKFIIGECRKFAANLTFAVGVFFLIALSIAGCGVEQERFSEEARAVREIVPRLPGNAKTSPQRFASQFIEGKAPMADRAKYVMVQVVANRATINEDKAVLEVRVLNPQTGEDIATQEWTAVKVDGQWKLKDAPLP